MHYSIKKFGIFLVIISFYTIPSGQANAFEQYELEQTAQIFEDATNEYENRKKEINEIKTMGEAFGDKIENGLKLLKKGDKFGGCRDLFTAIDLHDKIETREMLYDIKYGTSAKLEIAQSEKRALSKQLLDLAKTIYAKACVQS